MVARLEHRLPRDRWVAPAWSVRDPDREEIARTVEYPVAAKRLTGVLGAPAIFAALEEPITLRALQAELKRLREAGLVVVTGKGRATVY